LLALGALLALIASVLVWASPTHAQASNQPPVAIALTPSVSTDGNTMTLNGSLSFDPDDGDPAACAGCTYKWEVVTSTWKFLEGFADGTATLTSATAQIDVTNVNLPGLVPSNGALIEFRLTVTDAKGASDSDSTTYNIMTNDTPTADISLTAMLADPDADDDATTAEKYTIDAVIDGPGENGNADNEWDIMEGALLVLDGSGSSDPDDDDLNYLWSLVYETGSTTGVNFPTNDDGTSHGSGATSTLVATGATTAKISTDGSVPGTPDANMTVGRLNVAPEQGAISQSPYNVIYTLAVTDAGAAVTTGATGNVDSTALIRIVIHDKPADPKITAVLIGGDADPRDPQIDDGDTATTTAADRIDRAFPPGDKYFVHEGDDALDITLTPVTFDADQDVNNNGSHTTGTTPDTGETPPTVTWSEDDADGDTAGHQLRIPANAEAGDTFTITATIPRTDVSRTLTFEVIEPQQRPVATILSGTTQVDHDGDGNTPTITVLTDQPKDGTYTITGFGFDPDGGSTTSVWAQVNAEGVVNPGDDGYVPLTGAFSNSVSFDIPDDKEITSVTLAFSVFDDENSFDSKSVTVNIDRTPDPVPPSASAGSGQVVAPETTVILTGSSAGFDADTTTTYAWTVVSVSTSPGPERLNLRASMKVHEDLNSFIEAANANNYTNTGVIDEAANTAGTEAVNAEDILTSIPASADATADDVASGQFQWFEAPKLSAGLKFAQITFRVTATGTIGGTADSTRTGDVTITVATDFFSSYIDGPNYCRNLSFGGPTTEPHDSNGDGVADVCSLTTTRRETVARQNALEALVSLGSTLSRQVAGADTPNDDSDDVFQDVDLEDLVLGYTYDAGTADDTSDDVSFDGTCATAKNVAPEPEDADACDDDATELTALPDPVDPADAATFYSGVVTGPDFCINRSLGGAITFAHDGDGDGVAEVCSLHTTRREAVARQIALEMFRAHAQFNNALAAACAELGSETFGADAADLAKDGCSIPPGTPEAQPGNQLP